MERVALRILQIGAVSVVIAATTRKIFDLDRFLVPKELALHLTVLLAGLFAIAALKRVRLTRIDLFLIIYLLLNCASALFATNHWVAMRALAVTVSSVAIFWIARAMREAGLERPLLNALAFAVALATAISLAQAYGLRLELFSINRAPGGTLGNRNFVAHMAAFGMPVAILAALHARTTSRYLIGSLGVAVATAALVLTRSRAAYLAAGAVAAVFLLVIVMSHAMRRDWPMWRRGTGVVLLAAGGVAAALLIPNTLRWRSDNPYVESMRGVANYQEGSGHGRLVQYQHSLVMALTHPLFGVGPGNWAVIYPKYAAKGDPSLDESEPGTTMNPWPSSDWVAFISERGPAAALLLALAFIRMALAALRSCIRAETAERALVGATLLGTLVAAVVAGAFDAVLLLGAPAFMVWSALGALFDDGLGVRRQPALSEANGQSPLSEQMAESGAIADDEQKAATAVAALQATRTVRAAAIVAILIAGLGVFRSASQIAAMEIYATTHDRGPLLQAARIDPGNYRLRMRLATSGSRKQRCGHALAARDLFPNAQAAKRAARGCE